MLAGFFGKLSDWDSLDVRIKGFRFLVFLRAAVSPWCQPFSISES
jgi:hypothetical protein